jgi:hypothetical protein
MYFLMGAAIFSAFAYLGGPGWAYSKGSAAFYILGYCIAIVSILAFIITIAWIIGLYLVHNFYGSPTRMFNNMQWTPVAVGLVLAAALAAAISTQDAITHAAGSIFTQDILEVLGKQRHSEKQATMWIRISVVVSGFISYLVAFFGKQTLVSLLTKPMERHTWKNSSLCKHFHTKGERLFSCTGVVGAMKLGGPGKTLLIRSGMDALLIDEATYLSFASTHKDAMRACGHDCHMSMDAEYEFTFAQGYPPTMGCEDMAFFLERLKGCYSFLGVGKEGCAPLHNPKFLFNEDVLPIGVEIYCRVAFEVLR